jgi:hypothetical protein
MVLQIFLDVLVMMLQRIAFASWCLELGLFNLPSLPPSYNGNSLKGNGIAMILHDPASHCLFALISHIIAPHAYVTY